MRERSKWTACKGGGEPYPGHEKKTGRTNQLRKKTDIRFWLNEGGEAKKITRGEGIDRLTRVPGRKKSALNDRRMSFSMTPGAFRRRFIGGKQKVKKRSSTRTGLRQPEKELARFRGEEKSGFYSRKSPIKMGTSQWQRKSTKARRKKYEQ